MEALTAEYNEILRNDYCLDFVYPNERLRARLRVVNRDMSAEEKQNVKSAKQKMSTLVQQLAAGDVQLDDLPEKDLETLRELLGKH